MTCPFRIDRKISLTVQGEFHDFFCFCIEEGCPCYTTVGNEKWCYRDQIRLPLNEEARNCMECKKELR